MNNKNLKQYDAMYSYPARWWGRKKFLREWHSFLYKLRFRKRQVEHLGLELTMPLTSWMGKYLIVPNEFFMSKCIHAALQVKPGVAFDIGTHAGEFLIRYQAVCNSLDIHDGEYYGFEPNYASFAFINELIGANSWGTHCHVLPVALADTNGLRTFYASRYADPCSSIHPTINQGDSNFNNIVPTFSADSLLQQLSIDALSIIKIDAEGAELDILKGLARTLQQYRPCIHCEIANIPAENDPSYQYVIDNNRKVIELMQSMDYQTYAIVEEVDFYHHIVRFDDYLPHLAGPIEGGSVPSGGNYIMAHDDDIPELLSFLSAQPPEAAPT